MKINGWTQGLLTHCITFDCLTAALDIGGKMGPKQSDGSIKTSNGEATSAFIGQGTQRAHTELVSALSGGDRDGGDE